MLSRQVASSARTMSSQRFFSTASIAASEGKGQPLSEKEKAHENQWAQKHVSPLSIIMQHTILQLSILHY